ncbi:MAG: O-antigen ligase family protein [Bacilli bacterium]
MIIKKFLESSYFMIIIYAATLGFWYLKIHFVATAITIAIGLILTLYKTKKVVYLTLAMGILINYRDTSLSFNQNSVFLAVGILFPFALVSFIKTKINMKDLILIGFLVYLGANILSLITIPHDLLDEGIAGVTQTLAFVYIYIYFHNRKEPNDHEYIAKSYIFFGLTIFLEFIIFVLSFQGTFTWDKAIVLGWGITNSIAMVILLILPIIIYFILKHPKHIYLTALIVALLTLLVLTLSKAAYIALALLFIPFGIFTYFSRKTKQQKQWYWLSLGITLMFSVAAYFIATSQEQLVEGFRTYILRMDERGWFNDVARLEIYQYAWDLFKQHPILGTGSFTAGYYLTIGFNAPLLKHYHNFVMQLLATIGSVGFISFCFLLFAVIKKAFSKSLFNVCVLFSLLAMIIHGLMDNTFHNPLIMINMTILFAYLEDAPTIGFKDVFKRKQLTTPKENPDE